MRSHPPCRLGLGTSKLASFSSLLSPAQGAELLDLALKKGIRYFDTSNVYGQGRAEKWLGSRLSKEDRSSYQLATKAGLVSSPKAKTAAIFYPALRIYLLRRRRSKAAASKPAAPPTGPGLSIVGEPHTFRPPALKGSLTASLRRLRVRYVDDFFLHEPPLSAFTRELSSFLDGLLSQGIARRAGVCSNNPEVLKLARTFEPLSVLQTDIRLARDQAGLPGRKMSFVVNQVLSDTSLPLEPSSTQSPAQQRLRAALESGMFETVLFGTSKPGHLLEAAEVISREH